MKPDNAAEHRANLCPLVFLGLAAVMALLIPANCRAQVLYGSIVGHITDPSGAAVPGAKVHAINEGTNISRVAVTNSAGDYSFTDAVAGTYTIQVAREGFKTSERKDIPVTINAVRRVDVVLEVGTITQTVEVSGGAPLLQTDTPEVHANVDTTALANLPVPLGRNYQQIYRAEPGFSPPSNSHSFPTNPARSLSFNVNGTSNNQNNTRIDGVSTYNVQLPHVNSYVPTLDSIQQVNVATDSFDAEQGFAGGAAINVETKSGTNHVHGDIFEYHNNNHLKAWPMQFDQAATNRGTSPKFIYNDFGGAIGGPIKKNKLFFFTSYEGLYNNFNAQTFGTVPTQAMRTGDLSAGLGDYDCLLSGSIETNSTPGCPSDGSTPMMVTTTTGATVQLQDNMVFDPATGSPSNASGRLVFESLPSTNAACANAAGCLNMIPTARLDPIAQHILTFVPLPNRTGTKNDLFVSGDRVFHRNQSDTKIDYNATSKLTFIGTFGVLHYNNITPTKFGVAGGGPEFGHGGNPGHGFGNTFRTTILGTYTVSPNLVVDAHFGWARQGTSSVQNDLGKNIGSEVLGIPGTNGTRFFESGWPEFQFQGGSGGFDTIGQNENFMPYYRHDPQKQYAANFNWMKGVHNIRFGTEIYSQALNQTQAESLSGSFGAQGGFDFGQGTTQICAIVNADGSCALTSNSSRFNSAGSFLLGVPDVLGRNLQVPTVFHVHANIFSAYIRDRWTYSPKLTLDYGLRWEYYPMPGRSDRGIEVYNPATNNVELCGFGSVPSGCGVQISKRLFAPRVGFAYRATDTLVVRAGYGITIDPYEAMEPIRNNYPISIPTNITNPRGNLFGAGTLAAGIPAITVPSNGNGILPLPTDVVYEGYPSRKFDRGYIQSWNFTIQKQLRWGFTAQAGYVATRQVRLLGFLDTNAGQVIGAGACGQLLYASDTASCEASGGTAGLRYGRTATTTNIEPVGAGHYDSLQALLQRRFTGGLMMQVSYSWSKAISNVDNSDASPGDEKLQIFNLMHLNETVTDYDRTHNLEILHVWELPFGKGQKWLSNRGRLSYVVGGWQASGLASFISGAPFTVYASGSGFATPGSNQTADQVKTHVAFVGATDINRPFYDPTAFADVNGARLGTVGFNTLRGPGIANYDFALSRDFVITERYKLQFRMDSFNFTNTPHFCCVDNFVSDGLPGPPNFGSFMTVTSLQDLAREGIDERQFEFSLKLVF
jgi:hypothetical protein